MLANRSRYFTGEAHLSSINGIKSNRGKNLLMKDMFFTLMVCKHKSGKILQMREIFFTLNLLVTEISRWWNFTNNRHFSIFNLQGIQINRWRNFTNVGYLPYINGIQASRSRYFTDKGNFFDIHPLFYPN